jgi:hypothetical protein
MESRNIVIAMGRCSQSKQGFGIRFERRGGDEWAGTWAFAIKDAVAKKEGYEKTRMNGTFSFDAAFPGCPHCSSQSFFLCGCGRLACMKGEGHRVTCPWCGGSGEVSGVATSLDGGADR